MPSSNPPTNQLTWNNYHVSKWDNDTVLDWLSNHLKFSDVVLNAFQQHGIQGEDLNLLEREDLKELGITRIPQIRRFFIEVKSLLDLSTSAKHEHSHCDIDGQQANGKINNLTVTNHSKKLMDRVHHCFPALFTLIGSDLHKELVNSENEQVVKTDAFYWFYVEIMFTLQILKLRLKEELAYSIVRTHTDDSRSVLPYFEATVPELQTRLVLITDLLSYIKSRLSIFCSDDKKNSTNSLDSEENSWMPIFLKVAKAYKLTTEEKHVIQCTVLVKTRKLSPLWSLLSFGDEGKTWISSDAIQYICGLSKLQINDMLDDFKPIIKERIIELHKDEYSQNSISIEAPNEVCKALLGIDLNTEENLKIAETTLLSTIEKDQIITDNNSKKMKNNDSYESSKISDYDDNTGIVKEIKKPTNEKNSSKETLTKDKIHQMLSDLDSGEPLTRINNLDDKKLSQSADESDEQTATCFSDDKEPCAYTCELEYLNDQFALVMQQVQLANQRMNQTLKEASLFETKPRWMRQSGEPKKSSLGEATAKVKLAQKKIDLSLRLTKETGKFYPRLEELVVQLGLVPFERSVLIYLCGSMISPIFKSSINPDEFSSDYKRTVGDMLIVFCPSFSEQVAHRVFFYQSSTLIKKGLIRICDTYNAMDLTDHNIQLDRRVLDCIVGLDKESTEVVTGSFLYEPKVEFDSVVLPPLFKRNIADAVAHFDKFRAYRKKNNFDKVIAYGVGLTLMFCGASGTGKTMTANAIASKLGKKVLLVNFPLLSEKRRKDGSNCFQSIFREAELSNAIIFFDECESLFSKRESGGSVELTELLTELERFNGIVFLATNRPFDLDEAMYRRISEVFDFKPPTFMERLKIWKLVTSHDAIPCNENINWETIALHYELTGGFIKNVVLSALLAAVGRNSNKPLITQQDIVEGCKKQMRGALQMNDFDERVIPLEGLDGLIISESVRKYLQEIVDIEKARGVLFGSWGFDESMRDRQGTTALFCGPSGVGKSRAAEAVGFELGKPLKVVDFPQLLGKRSSKSSLTIVREVFKEARLMNAVLILDGHSLQTEGAAENALSDDTRLLNLLVKEMTRFPGVVIMMLETNGSLDVFLSRIDKGLITGLKFLVEFDLPNLKSRKLFWKKTFPKSIPTSEEKINFSLLANLCEGFNFIQISNALYRAAASAALRQEDKRFLTMLDLTDAVKAEKKRGESALERWVKSTYI